MATLKKEHDPWYSVRMNSQTETFELKQSGYKFVFDGALTIRCRDASETRLSAEATGTITLVKKRMKPGDSFKFRVWDGTRYDITLIDRQGEADATVVTVSVNRTNKKLT